MFALYLGCIFIFLLHSQRQLQSHKNFTTVHEAGLNESRISNNKILLLQKFSASFSAFVNLRKFTIKGVFFPSVGYEKEMAIVLVGSVVDPYHLVLIRTERILGNF